MVAELSLLVKDVTAKTGGTGLYYGVEVVKDQS